MRVQDVFAVLSVLAFALGGGLPANAAEVAKTHKIVIQVDAADAPTMNLALGNAINAKAYYDTKKESVAIEIVTYGPGIDMLRADKSPVKDRIADAKKAIPNLVLDMCGNAKTAAEKREGHAITALPGIVVVPAGIVRVVELQEQGYAYVKP